MKYEDGLVVWDVLCDFGIMVVGVEIYVNFCWMEKFLCL